MDIDKAKEFISEHHHAVLLTTRADGSPQLSPILIGLDADGLGIVSTRETAYKTRNIRRSPQVSVCVMNDRFYGKWIQIDGHAEILSLPEALEPLVDYYERTVGDHPDWEEYRAAMVKERRVLLRIAIEKAGPVSHG